MFALIGLLPDEQFDGRGWRGPFLSAFMLLAVGLYLRARVEGTDRSAAVPRSAVEESQGEVRGVARLTGRLRSDGEVDGEPIGYAMARVKDEAQGSWESGARTGVLESLSLQSDQRGSGIGTRLFEAVRSEYVKQDAAQLELSVITSNGAAIGFYAGQGLVPYVTTLVGRS